MGLDDAPAFGEADPDLGLAAADRAVGRGALEFEGDGGEVAAEAGDVQAGDGTGQVGRGAGFAEGFEFGGAVEVFADAEALDLISGPEHFDEGGDVVGDEGGLVAGVEGG